MGSLQPTQICTILVQASGFDELAGEVRKGNYNIDATAIAITEGPYSPSLTGLKTGHPEGNSSRLFVFLSIDSCHYEKE